MNELQFYTSSIPDSNPNKAELIRQWKIKNKWGQQEVKEVVEAPVKEVKEKVVVEEDAPAATTPEASESSDSGSGNLKSSLFGKSDFQKSYEKQDKLNKEYEKNKADYEAQMASLSKVSTKGSTYSANNSDYKWDVDDENKIQYYTKDQNTDDWVNLNKNNGSQDAQINLAAAQLELGHRDDITKKELEEARNQPIDLGINQEKGVLWETQTYAPPMSEYIGDVIQEDIEQSPELTYYTAQKNKLKEIELDRKELKDKSTRFAEENFEDQASKDQFIVKELANFDEQYRAEIELLGELDGLTDLQASALAEIKKDTGNNASTFSIPQQLGQYFNSLTKAVGLDFERNIFGINMEGVFRDPENIELNNEIELNIVNSLDKRTLQKLSSGNFNLQEKEDLINEFKVPVIKRKSKFLSSYFENVKLNYDEALSGFDSNLEGIKSEMTKLKSLGLNTPEQIQAYNSLVSKYTSTADARNEKLSFYKKELSNIAATKSSIEGNLNMSFSRETLRNNFKLSDEVERYRESFSGDGFWNGTMDILGGEVIGGLYEIGMKSVIGFPAAVMAGFGDLFTDEKEYSFYDAWRDTVYNFTDYSLVPKSEDEKFKITTEEGGFNKDASIRNYLKLGGQMLPFTLHLMNEVKKGKITSFQKGIGKTITGLGSKSKVLSPVSSKLKDSILMADATFRATLMDNVKEAEAKGLFGGSGLAYASAVSLTEGLVQTIMPDAQFLKGVGGKKIKDIFSGKLKNIATKEGFKAAGKEFTVNILKELGEEEINAAMNIVTDASFGLALPKSSEFLNSQIELIAGTLMLSGGMGSIGAVKTFNNQKTLIYSQIHKNINSTMMYLDAMKKSSNNPETIEQIIKAQMLAFNVSKAMSKAPGDVTGAEVDLLMEKTELLKEKENVDSSFHGPINEKIAKVDEQIVEINKTKIAESKSRAGAKNISDQIESTLETFSDQAKIDERVKEIKEQGGNVLESTGYGQALVLDGKKIILINDQAQAEDFKYTTDQHELLHHFFLQTFQTNPDAAIKFGQALVNEIVNNPDITGGFEFMSRFNDYLSDENYSAENTWEEVIPLLSESLTDGDIVYNKQQDGFWKSIGKQISSLFKDPGNQQKLGITFDTGLDAFNFIKDFNDTIQSGGKLTEDQVRIAKEGAKGELVTGDVKIDGRKKGGKAVKTLNEAMVDNTAEVENIVAKESKREVTEESAKMAAVNLELSNKLQEAKDEGDTQLEADIKNDLFLENQGIIVDFINTKFKPGLGISKSEFTSGVQEEVLIYLNKTYQPSDGEYGAYIRQGLFGGGSFRGGRLGNILKRLGQEGDLFSKDIDSAEAQQVASEEIITTSKPAKETITKQTDATSFGPAKNKKQDLESIIQVKDADRPNFKSLNNKYFNDVAKSLFGIDGKKVRGNASLKYGGTKTDPTSSEANALQNVFKNSENVKSFIKTMPEYNVATKETIINKQGESIDASRDVYGRALGINPKVLEVFYDKVTRAIPDISNPKGRSLGKTSQTQVYKLKPEFKGTIGKEAITKLQSLIGITPAGELSIPVKGPARTEFGSALTGLSKMYVDNVINTIGRSKLDSKQAKADLGAGKPKSMASKRITTKAAISPALMTVFKDLSILRNKKQLAASLGFSSPPINESNRKAQQDLILEAVIKYGLDTATIEAGMMGSGGRQSFYGNIVNGKFVKKSEKNGGKKYVKTTDGEYILENSERGKLKGGEVTNWVAKPGRLYYGNEDPAFQALIKETKKYEGKKAKRVGVKGAFTEKSAKQSEINMGVLDHVVNQLADAVAKGMSLDVAGAIIIQSYQATSGLVKISAPFKYKSTLMEYAGLESKVGQRTGEKFREEHNPPASVIGAQIMFAIKYNAATPIMKAIKENYYQTQLSKKDDNKLDMAKLDATLVEGQTIFDNPISRLAAAGIDLQTLVNPLTGKTIAEESGFGIDPKVYNKYNANEKVQASSIQNEAILEGLKNPDLDVASEIKASLPLVPGKSMASKRDSDLIPDSIKYDTPITVQKAINALEKTDKALANGRKLDQPVKKIRVFDFDDTLARTKSNVLYTMPDGTTGAIDAATFAKEAGNMEAEGAQWDFSEFSKVMQGSKGPLLDVAKIIADKRGTKDVFVLTARPANAAGPIKEFLASMGLDIPLANITGLGDGTPQAKAGWIMGKAAEGYNDFYFADDHTGNVKAVKDVLSQIDVKSKVQLAKASKRQTFDTIVNDMIEDSSGIETYKNYSAARAKTVGANKGKFNFFIPPSAEDFTGLLYKMLGKGKKGDAQMAFLKANLLDPYDRAESAVTQAKISAANDFKALKTELKSLPTSLSVPTGIGGFTYSHAVRTAIWTAQGMDIPGLSKKDVKELNDFVQNDPELRVFANELIKIQKGKPYPKPGKDWLGGNITSDIINDINKVNRAEYQQEWRENVDIIFSEDNMNKMEAAYGTRWREAMEDSLRRMKSGSNRPPGGNRSTDAILDWLNNSVGAVMFLNTRSALLQTISAVNFINWGDNNIVKAGAAFANQKQFWSDFMTLMNSDYLVERRNGLKINVSESEIADAVRDSGNKVKAAISFLLSKGFVMTRFADSFAIATGGSTFYRNRVKALVAKGMEQKAAEAQAFSDFRQIAEESQQSSNPNRISAQQASAAGRVILAWANTPMQYARIQKRAGQDLINGRGDWRTNVSKIVYYGAIQNLIFNSLQQAVFALGFGEDDEDEDAKKNEKISRVANGMIDSQLKGLGIGGAAVLALKSTLMELGKQHAKKRPEYDEAVFDLLNFSPPLGSKVQKIRGGLRSFSWNKKDMKEKGFSLDNPSYLAGAQVVTGLTNVPLDRVAKKINNVRGIVNEESALWQKVALGLGWSTWDVGLGYYGGFDAAKVLTPEEEKVKEIDDMKKLTKTKEQVDMLLDLGLSKKEIKALGKEQNRVEKIIELQNAEAEPKKEAEVKEEIKEETKPTPVAKPKPTPKPKVKTVSAEARLRRQFDSIKDENKPDQVKTLLKFGLSKKEIRALRYEKNRVEKILELMKK